jgi:ATP-dependent Clp protease adapter protein ClpS
MKRHAKEDVMDTKVEASPDTVVGSPLGSYAVRVFNNEVTPFGEVVGVFIISCGYSEAVAGRYAIEIHTLGSSICYWASKERCETVIQDFKKIGVAAELIEEKS